MYGKLFTSMYDGTLATKGPWQALVCFQQMLILADKDGVVDMTAGAISRRTSIPLEIIEIGIEELMQPDPESRSSAEDGRRLALLEAHRTWGWQIVNYRKYAEIRSAEERREYLRKAQADHRAAKKASTSVNKSIADKQTSTLSTDVPVDVDVPVEVKTLSTATPSHPRKRGVSGVEGFDLFWKAYPRKTAKAAALKAFAKLAPSADMLDAMLRAIAQQKQSKQWQDGIYPHPATWINGRRWEDEALPVGVLPSALTVPNVAGIAQTASLLREQADAAERARGPEAQAARLAVMARLKGVAA